MKTLPLGPLVEHVMSRRTSDDDPRNALYEPIPFPTRSPGWSKWRGRLFRATRVGSLRIDWAEDYCDILGVHPTAIWGLDYFDACDACDGELIDK